MSDYFTELRAAHDAIRDALDLLASPFGTDTLPADLEIANERRKTALGRLKTADVEIGRSRHTAYVGTVRHAAGWDAADKLQLDETEAVDKPEVDSPRETFEKIESIGADRKVADRAARIAMETLARRAKELS